jgi:SAM-dependent methyltransferase
MTRSPEEQAQRQRFEEFYVTAQSPVMLSIERSVCGCGYGGNSWTTQPEARAIAALLELRPGMRLLDVGAGSGWPGLYMAEASGCDVVLVDLPLAGLRIGAERAETDRLPGACWAAVADAADLPFADGSFDRRVIGRDGRMVFTVISVAPGLSRDDHKRAVENGPEFIEVEADYETLLGETGWTVLERRDITTDYIASCQRQLEADEAWKDPLEALIGPSEFAERQAEWRSKLMALDAELLRRELFFAVPDSS